MSGGLLELPNYGVYDYYYSLVVDPSIISSYKKIIMVEPTIEIINFDEEMTLEDIKEAFSKIDADGDKVLSLTEISLYYLNLKLERGILTILAELSEDVDTN